MMPPSSVLLIQACCHNPTGLDLSFEQWKEVSELIKTQNVFPFLDIAYQGFGKDLDTDAKAIRYFADQGHEMAVAISYSKNLGLYGERAGALAIVTKDKETAGKVLSNIKQLVRSCYSNPPLNPAEIVKTVFKTPALKKEWVNQLAAMRNRIDEMREALAFGLMAKSLHRDFSFITRQQGIFSYSGLDKKQVQKLRDDWGVYMLENGRINVAGINQHNIEYVIESILAVCHE